MLHAISLSLLLGVLWLLLSGHGEPLLLSLGAVSVLAVVLIARRMEVIDRESHPIHLTSRLPLYWLWLGWEIVKANLAVAKLILSPSLPISPTVIRVRASQRSELGQVIYANSITLTPGTVSLTLERGHIDVHAVTDAMAQDVAEGGMDRRIARLEA